MNVNRRQLGINLVYDGDDSRFDEFESAFRYECLIYGWDDGKKAEGIKLCLTGKAKKIYDNLKPDDKKDVEKILEALKTNCIKSPEYYLNLFYARQLKQDEPISDFCHHIERLVERGMPGLDQASKYRLLMARLLAVVPENIKSF